MTEQQQKARFKQAIDHTLSSIQGDPFLAQRLLARAEKGAKPMKYHIPKTIVIALITLLCMGTVALAAGLYGGTVNWLGEVVPDERVPSVMPTMAPVMETEYIDFDEDMLDSLRQDGTKLMVYQQLEDGTRMPDTSTRMMREAETMDEFQALLGDNTELPLPNFIPEGYEFVRGEVYYQCREGGSWELVEQRMLDGGFMAEWYTLDEADALVEAYYLFYRESPEDYHYLSVYAGLSERQDVEEQVFGFLPGQTASAVQVAGMDYALAITAENSCSLSMLRDLDQPVGYLHLWESGQQEQITFEQLDMSVSAPLLDVDTLVRMFAE